MLSLDSLVEQLYIKMQQATITVPKQPSRSISVQRKTTTTLLPTQILHNATLLMNRNSRSQSRHRTITETRAKSTRYRIQNEIGIGTSGIVYQGIDTYTNELVAIKKYTTIQQKHDRVRQIVKEARILKKLDHPNILKYCIHTMDSLITVHLEGTTLSEYLKLHQNRRIKESVVKSLYTQLASALALCHKQNIAHRDIKTDNIMIHDGKVVIIDFGLASESLTETDYCGTPSYMAPEIFLKLPHCGKKADIWALGVVVYQLLCGKLPFKGRNNQEIRQSQCQLIIPYFVSPSMAQLLQKLLNNDPLKRCL